MRKKALLFALLIASLYAFAQHGDAPSGYWPSEYNGDTFTGNVADTNDSTREITLVYHSKKKEERFTGMLQDGYKAKFPDGTLREMKPSDLPNGAKARAYYIVKQKKENGQKIVTNLIFRIEPVKD